VGVTGCANKSPTYDAEWGELRKFSTGTFTCHNFESASGIKIVLNTDRKVGDMQNELQHIFAVATLS
jgi:hypothetical protein